MHLFLHVRTYRSSVCECAWSQCRHCAYLPRVTYPTDDEQAKILRKHFRLTDDELRGLIERDAKAAGQIVLWGPVAGAATVLEMLQLAYGPGVALRRVAAVRKSRRAAPGEFERSGRAAAEFERREFERIVKEVASMREKTKNAREWRISVAQRPREQRRQDLVGS